MPVEFLTDEQAAAYGRFVNAPSRAELEQYFFLDDLDWELIEPKRRDHHRLGFAASLTTARYLGVFPVHVVDEVPAEVVSYLAEQLEIDDPSCLKRYTERDKTRLEHAWEIQRVYGFVSFAEVDDELTAWVDARAWTTGEGPKALFDGAVS